MQASNAPSKSAVPFAESGTKNTIPVDSQIGVTPGAASFTDGFPPLTMTPLAAGGVPPYGADFNGILNFLSAAVRWAQAGGGYAFDNEFSTAIGGYPAGAILRSSDGTKMWLSLANNNATDPAAGPSANWVEVAKLVSPAFTGTPTAPTPSAGDSTTRIATTAFVQNAVQGVAVAPGFVLPFAASTPPAGWLRANGAAVSRTTYAALFAAIGTTFGSGDGSTTFNLPDVRAEFPRFWDDGRGIDANPSPRVIGSTQLGTAFVFDIGSNASVTVSRVLGLNGLQSRAAVGVDSGVVSDYNSAVGYYSTASTASGGLPESAELNWGVMRPRNIALLGCIKY